MKEYYFYSYLMAFSTINIINDLEKKNNKSNQVKLICVTKQTAGRVRRGSKVSPVHPVMGRGNRILSSSASSKVDMDEDGKASKSNSCIVM